MRRLLVLLVLPMLLVACGGEDDAAAPDRAAERLDIIDADVLMLEHLTPQIETALSGKAPGRIIEDS